MKWRDAQTDVVDNIGFVIARNFASSHLSLTWRNPGWEVSIEAENITDTRGSRFAFGNPFHVRQASQQVPLRPFNVRRSAKPEM